ncbi:MAG: NADPH-dependent F420 reductase [Proteobacteria bacterium]|nr:NADPH-dependent F420 reductase [Pseudomonadota bacterium]MCP4922126.1 NADPH-dependent F420 reductase [Pseudomonadota bacterium]
MRIGLIGGTGREGTGLALRWKRAGHDVFLGSRDAARGQARAKELGVQGGSNEQACDADVVLLAVPYGAHAKTLTGLRDALSGRVLIDITVPLAPSKVQSVNLPSGQSAALEAQALLPETTVVAALHHVSSAHLADLEHTPDCDVLVCSNDKPARALVADLMNDLGLRGLEAGRLKNAIALESLTPVLIFMNKKYGTTTGLRVTGIE